MFTSLITAYVNIIHAKFQSQSQQYPIIFRLLNISRENIVTLFRLPLIFTYFSLCHNYKRLLRLFDDGKIFIPLFLFLLYPTTCITVLKSLRQKIHLSFLFYHIYIYLYTILHKISIHYHPRRQWHHSKQFKRASVT